MIKNKNITKNIEDEINTILYSNTNKKDTLILSGGGLKGIQILGALKYLEELEILKNINLYVGTSIGAYISILLIIGYNIDEIYKFSKIFDFKKTVDIKFDNIFTMYSFDDSKNYKIIFNNLLKKKNIDSNITLLDFYKLTKKKIVLCTICINDKKAIYISYENYPELPLITAIQMSTAIPLLFPPVKYNNKLYIDGGIIDNFPINYLIDLNNLNNLTGFNNIIGINLYTDYKDMCEVNNIKDYITCILDIVRDFLTKDYTIDIYKNIVYNIPSYKQNITNMVINTKEKKKIFKDAYNFMKKEFNPNQSQNHE